MFMLKNSHTTESVLHFALFLFVVTKTKVNQPKKSLKTKTKKYFNPKSALPGSRK